MENKVAYIGGTFDLLHYGHIRLFERAKNFADKVVVSVNTDEFATRYKRKPVMSLFERMRAVSGCKFVDEVITNHGDEDSKPAILESGATHIIHGSDWKGDALMKQMGFDQAWLDEHGIQMHYLPYTIGISSTDIIDRIK